MVRELIYPCTEDTNKEIDEALEREKVNYEVGITLFNTGKDILAYCTLHVSEEEYNKAASIIERYFSLEQSVIEYTHAGKLDRRHNRLVSFKLYGSFFLLWFGVIFTISGLSGDPNVLSYAGALTILIWSVLVGWCAIKKRSKYHLLWNILIGIIVVIGLSFSLFTLYAMLFMS
ncbi:hypothetical protein [Rummeliibacillus stabekisii]|uniref:hypothetical protein n=1 Tax=Rummeliibacillus stabekisii TaxID=241244 RepID=UPI0011675C6E|nr:hypothetical protein [Rummeliibacillus stabekisii]MBB5170988.1 hypothetical protein [Rummeliibacillus stabekisii]GEL05358.1 hypothetical protein RST01_19850 [Rummeliibacillus stabekisii]